jgi:hypothetical protein
VTRGRGGGPRVRAGGRRSWRSAEHLGQQRPVGGEGRQRRICRRGAGPRPSPGWPPDPDLTGDEEPKKARGRR